jgi:hypothetical protein
MKTSIRFTLAMLGLVALLMPMHLAAQSGTFRIAVPFDFAVDSQAFAAGVYYVSSNGDGVVHISSAGGEVNRAMLAYPVYPTSRGMRAGLVFRRYGDDYFLSRVWSNADVGFDLPRSRGEREALAKIEHAEPITIVASGQ